MGLFTPKVSVNKLVPMCRQLATANDAGIPVMRTLELVGGEFRDRKVRGVLTEMRDDISQGETLGGAAEKQSKYLPRIFVELLRAGEEGGRLEYLLRDLADYYEDVQAMRRRALMIMAYPLIILAAAWFLVPFAFMISGRVTAAFARGGTVDFAALFADYGAFQAKSALVAALVFAVLVILGRLGVTPYLFGVVRSYAWPFSRISRRFAQARFLRTLSLLIGSGVELTRCVRRAASVTNNPYLERNLLRALEPLRQGRTMVEAFSNVGVLDRTSREMLAVGEQSGNMEQALNKAANYHLEAAEQAVHIWFQAFKVLLIVGLGAVILFVLIRFYTGFYGGLLDGI
jgi:type IV pilus assembly protein PilC